jgi:SAM-dependent methyltransferase
MMTVEVFFEHLLAELKENKSLWAYHKFLTDPAKLPFRKAYFCQRLQYIIDHIGPNRQKVWDCGCGFGSTALFLAMNGYQVRGTTLEFYFDQIGNRKKFWSAFGNTDLFECSYEDLFESHYHHEFDTVIVQDTLHHLYPLEPALDILHRSMKTDGRVIVIEENGRNLLQRAKLLKQRGFNKKIEGWDTVLQKKISFADEHIRGLSSWKKLLQSHGFYIRPDSVDFIRLVPPLFFSKNNYLNVIRKEKKFSRASPLLKTYFYFGMNFIATTDKTI